MQACEHPTSLIFTRQQGSALAVDVGSPTYKNAREAYSRIVKEEGLGVSSMGPSISSDSWVARFQSLGAAGLHDGSTGKQLKGSREQMAGQAGRA